MNLKFHWNLRRNIFALKQLLFSSIYFHCLKGKYPRTGITTQMPTTWSNQGKWAEESEANYSVTAENVGPGFSSLNILKRTGNLDFHVKFSGLYILAYIKRKITNKSKIFVWSNMPKYWIWPLGCQFYNIYLEEQPGNQSGWLMSCLSH